MGDTGYSIAAENGYPAAPFAGGFAIWLAACVSTAPAVLELCHEQAIFDIGKHCK